MKGLKFVEILQITFENDLSAGKTTYKKAFFNCKTKTIVNINDILESIKLSQAELIREIGVWILERSVRVIETVACAPLH